MIIHENVPQCGICVLTRYLADMYIVARIVITPSQLGWPVSRPRQYCVMVRKDVWQTQVPASFKQLPGDLDAELTAIVLKFAARSCQWHWAEFFCVSPELVEQEHSWARSRPSVQRREHPEDEPECHAALTGAEIAVLEQVTTWNGEDFICDLGQNPQKRLIGARLDDKLPCLFRSQGIWFCKAFGRWMHAAEMLMAQGIPVFPDQITACPA